MKKFRVGIITGALFLALSLIAMLVLWIGGKFFNIGYNNLILQGLVIGFISTFALFILNNIIKKKNC